MYTYQNKAYNTYHYDKSNPEHKDYDSDIDFDLSYIRPNIHVKMVYDDIKTKYKNKWAIKPCLIRPLKLKSGI